MKRMWIGTAALAGGLAVLGVLLVSQVLPPFTRSHVHFAGTCRSLPMAAGAGDLALDAARGVAYLAYLDRSANGAGTRARGTVMLVDLNAAEPRVRAALVVEPPGFRPLALSLYVPREGARRLFVVDGSTAARAIQIFEQTSSGTFALVKTLRDPLLVDPTAILATGAERFYATTDGGWLDPGGSSRLARLWQLAFPASSSAVVHYDGRHMRTVATGLQMAAGIAVSPDGRVLYVSEMGGKRVHAFDRDAVDGTLRSKEVIGLDSWPDHLSTDVQGNLWIAAHPRITAALESREARGARTPTQVLRLSPRGTPAGRVVSEMYFDDGAELSAASAVLAPAGWLLAGSASDHKLLLCRGAR